MRTAVVAIVVALAGARAHADAPRGERFVGWTGDGRAVVETTSGARSLCAVGDVTDVAQQLACEPGRGTSSTIIVKAGAPRDRRGDARIVGAATCKRRAPCSLAITLVVSGKPVRSWTRDYAVAPDTRPSLSAVYFRGDGKVAVVIVREERPKRVAETRGFVLGLDTTTEK
jgi:hypothetical protein